MDSRFTSGSDTEEEVDEDFEVGDYAGLIMTVKEKHDDEAATPEDEMVYQKLCHLDYENAKKIKDLFEEYPKVIAEYFDDVRSSNVEVRHKFELIPDQSIF